MCEGMRESGGKFGGEVWGGILGRTFVHSRQ